MTWLHHWLHALILAVHSYPLLLSVWGIGGITLTGALLETTHHMLDIVMYTTKQQVVCLKKDLTYHRHSPCQLTNELQEAQ